MGLILPSRMDVEHLPERLSTWQVEVTGQEMGVGTPWGAPAFPRKALAKGTQLVEPSTVSLMSWPQGWQFPAEKRPPMLQGWQEGEFFHDTM